MPVRTVGQRLKHYITFHESGCGAGVSEARVLEFERKHGVVVPDDLRTYFTEFNGTAGDYAYGLIRFWSLDEIRSVTQEVSSKRSHTALIQSAYREPIEGGDNLFVFADCMHEAQLYAIHLSLNDKPNRITVLDGGEPAVLAESFSDFVERYLTTPEVLRLVVD